MTVHFSYKRYRDGCEMRKNWVYILDGVQMFGGILRDEAVDDVQSMVFSYKVCCRNCKENT